MSVSTLFCRESKYSSVKLRPEVKPNEKQKKLFKTQLYKKRFVAYGGARGGGKSWGARVLASLWSLRYPRLKILILRKTFPELEANHILPLMSELNGVAQYKAAKKMFVFPNGSFIKLGYCKYDNEATQYQGQEYDCIMFEEATLFSEYALKFIGSCLRTVRTDFRPLILYFCNPGGPSHHYIKRLFLDKEYEGYEKPEEHMFIPALVYDNEILMKNNPEYIDQLNNLPEDMIAAHRDGDWDALSGAYFKEFKREIHVIEPFVIPETWYTYFVMDYGLDCLAGYWIADDHRGNFYFTKEIWKPDLIISRAAKEILDMTVENVEYWYAPPDMQARRQDTGKTALEIFSDNGINFTTTKNDRVEGWLAVKELMKVKDTMNPETGETYKTSSLKIFSNCEKLIKHIPIIQRDEKNPCDVSKEPHELTHSLDALRYFASEYIKTYVPKEAGISGVYHRNELKMLGYSNSKINMLAEKGDIQLIGRK